jgi:catechol 2,3-dioxygenase-like lactoylglutathione lyase family enzyme
VPSPRRSLQSEGVVQIAFSVKDVAAAAVRFNAATGAGPFLLRPHVHVPTLTYHEADIEVTATMDHSIALGQWGAMMVELVDHHSIRPPAAAAALSRQGPGLHHVAAMADDLDSELGRLDLAGHRLLLRGSTADVDFAFAQLSDGGLLEVYQRDQPILERYRRIREAALGWDGRELFLS